MTNTIAELDRDDILKDRLFRKLRAAAASLNAVEQHVRSPRSVIVREGTALYRAHSLRLTQRELTKVTTKSETEGRGHFVEVIMYVRQSVAGDDGALGAVGFTFADAADAKSFAHYVFGRDIAEGESELGDREVRMLVIADSDADDEFSVDVADDEQEPALAANDRVARTLAALDPHLEQACDAAGPELGTDYSGLIASTYALLDHGAPDAVPPSVRRIAALLGCSVEAASYIDALETRIGRLEEEVSELRYDVRKVRRAA